jgi:hypothetical protein
MWEKKSRDSGVHDFRNLYTWSTGSSDPDGTVFTDLLAALNAPPCFAEHCDWRLPTVAELLSILRDPCTSMPCVMPVFDTSCSGTCTVTTCSCTSNDGYWTSESYPGDPAVAYSVSFPAGGQLNAYAKWSEVSTRAVRNTP